MPRTGGIRRAVYKRLKARTNDYCYTYSMQTIASLGGVDPGWEIYNIEEANRRMGVGPEWRTTEANMTYVLCPTYPAQITVPANAPDILLQAVAGNQSLISSVCKIYLSCHRVQNKATSSCIILSALAF